jgi:predicted peptidase
MGTSHTYPVPLPAIAVSPQYPTGSWWSLETYGLDALLDDLLARYRVDPRRIYLTGLNMGGYGT